MTHSLSFTVLKNMEHMPYYGPVHVQLEDFSRKSIFYALKEITNPYFTKNEDTGEYEKEDIIDFFHPYKMSSGTDIRCIKYNYRDKNAVNNLFKKGRYVFNKFKDIYVCAFAIDHQIFHIQSEGFPKRLIDWN